ncbi:MAG: hypothetical protein AB4290_05260 [Spirulina sp.]
MSSSSRPPLKVVPPTNIPQKQPSLPSQPEQMSSPSPESTPRDRSRRDWFRMGAIATILTVGGWYVLSPATIYVKGIASFEPHEEQIRGIFLDFPGKVTKFWVSYGEDVEKDQPLAEVEAIALETELAQKKIQLQEKQAQLEAQKIQITILAAELAREQKRTAIVYRREEDFRNQFNRGSNAPEIRKLRQEINAIGTRLMSIRSEQVKLIEQLKGVQSILKEYDTDIMRQLREDGAIARLSFTKEFADIQSRQATLQAQIQQQDQLALEIKYQMSAKSAELEFLQEKRQERLQEYQDELTNQIANLEPIQQKLAAAKIAVKNLIPVVNTLEIEVNKLAERHQKNTAIKSPLSGTIITPDLPQKIGQKITEDKPVLVVANLEEMVATIEITQGDAGLVKQVFGKRELPVTLKPREIEIDSFHSAIKDIEPLYDSDESGQKQLMRVRATFDNRDRILSPNSEADASIAVERLPRYRIWWREIWKQLRQYF